MAEVHSEALVIVGASHAGCALAESARKNGWEGPIQLIGDEAYLPYHRPPLSKDFLAGNKQVENILLRPESVYKKLNIDCILNARVASINRAEKNLLLDDGRKLAYSKLALTLGARARTVPIPGADKQGVFYLRTVDDIEAIRPLVKKGKKAVIVGGGYIGLETAASLRKLEVEVTVIEMMPRILQRVTAPVISEFYRRVHTEEGVSIITDAAVSEISGEEWVTGVTCKNGMSLPADFIIIGAGVLPNVELAQEADLAVENGIVVDEYATTSDPNIVAAGDCTWHRNPLYDRWLRLESVQNATDQARVAGATVCGNKETYNQLPWFWSDQYDIKLQIAGLSQGFDNIVIRGDITQGRKFAAFYFHQDALLAVDAVNMPMAFMVGKRLLLEGRTVSKAVLADEAVNLKSIFS